MTFLKAFFSKTDHNSVKLKAEPQKGAHEGSKGGTVRVPKLLVYLKSTNTNLRHKLSQPPVQLNSAPICVIFLL